MWQIESGDFFNWSEPHLILAPQDALGGASIYQFFAAQGYAPYSINDVLTSFRTYRDEAEFDVETMSVFASADWELSPALTLTKSS